MNKLKLFIEHSRQGIPMERGIVFTFDNPKPDKVPHLRFPTTDEETVEEVYSLITDLYVHKKACRIQAEMTVMLMTGEVTLKGNIEFNNKLHILAHLVNGGDVYLKSTETGFEMYTSKFEPDAPELEFKELIRTNRFDLGSTGPKPR